MQRVYGALYPAFCLLVMIQIMVVTLLIKTVILLRFVLPTTEEELHCKICFQIEKDI